MGKKLEKLGWNPDDTMKRYPRMAALFLALVLIPLIIGIFAFIATQDKSAGDRGNDEWQEWANASKNGIDEIITVPENDNYKLIDSGRNERGKAIYRTYMLPDSMKVQLDLVDYETEFSEYAEGKSGEKAVFGDNIFYIVPGTDGEGYYVGKSGKAGTLNCYFSSDTGEIDMEQIEGFLTDLELK